MLTKIDYSRRIAATLAYLAAQQGYAVGLATYAAKIVQNIPAKRSAATLKLLFDTLAKTKPCCLYTSYASEELSRLYVSGSL